MYGLDTPREKGKMERPVPLARCSCAIRKAAAAGMLAAALAAPAVGAIGKWSSLGPEGGLVSALLLDPSSPSVVWEGTYGGGLFVSRDGGGRWSRVATAGVGDVVNDLAAVPGGSLFAATNDGVLRSDDGGTGWVLANAGLTDTTVYSVAVDPVGAVYVGTQTQGVFRSDDGGRSWTPAGTAASVLAIASDPSRPGRIWAGTAGSGVVRSDDGGRSWTESPAAIADAFVFDVEVDPRDPSNLWAATFGGGVWKSIDGGTTWTPPASPFASASVYAVAVDLGSSATTLWAGTLDGGVWKSVDGGTAWAEVPTPAPRATVFAVRADPRAPGTVWAGTNFGTFKTEDGGASWAAGNRGMNGTVVNALAATPSGLYAATGGSGILRSADGGATWEAAETDALTVFALASDGSAGPTLYAGTDQGLWKSSGGGSWSAVGGTLATNNVYSVAVDPRNPSVVWAGTFLGGLLRSDDGGESWTAVPLGSGSETVFAIAIAPEEGPIYAGTGHGVFRSFDGGASWTAAGAGSFAGSAFSLAIDPRSPSVVYAGTEGSGIVRSADGGSTWRPAGHGLTASDVYSVAFDRTGGPLYAGTRNGGVFRSLDGETWSAVNAGLTSSTVFSLAFDGASPSLVYAGTYGGGVFEYSAAASAAVPSRAPVEPVPAPGIAVVDGR